MFRFFAAMDRFLRTLLGLLVAGIVSVAGWFGYQQYSAFNQERLELQGKLATANQQIQRLNLAVRLLKVDHRVARIDVLKQEGSAEKGDLTTTFQFLEFDREGKPVGKPRQYTIRGDVAYLDAKIIKFQDDYVEAGDSLRAASLCLFVRLFGEAQQPKDGFPIDPAGNEPAVYRQGHAESEFERELWSKFWDYANDPEKAKSQGVRAMHGEAPSMKLLPGKRYRVELRSSGGLTIVPDEGLGSNGAL